MRHLWLLLVVAQASAEPPRGWIRDRRANGTLRPCPVGDPTPLRSVVEADWRWPLDRAAELSPHADLGPYASVRWPELCADPPPLTGDAQAYVAAWCEVNAGHGTHAADRLATLARGRGPFAAAARNDVVDVIADALDGVDGRAWLQANQLADRLDALAATYLEHGRAVYASQVDTSLPVGRGELECRRLARMVREDMVADGSLPESCQDFTDMVRCPLVTGTFTVFPWQTPDDLRDGVRADLAACGSVQWRDSRADAQAHLWLAALAQRWPGPTAGPAQWLAYEQVVASAASWSDEVEAFALDALDNAIASSICSDEALALVHAAALGLRDHGTPHDPARIATLAQLTRAGCRARR
jgi:hypothetical protein